MRSDYLGRPQKDFMPTVAATCSAGATLVIPLADNCRCHLLTHK